ncbi:GFA family protein [Rhizobium ruizarguesonis]|nr:GFA family protein [Rhizobium leguminosarum bv. viciae]
MQTVVLTGGCQCGAVRYALEELPQNVHICHCRMCQKAVGGPFAIICPVMKPAFRLTRGAISYFSSSDVGRRGFCRDCGTPLTFDYPDGDDIGVLVGTLDQPDRAPPENQYGNESRVSWYANLAQVPGDRPTYADNPQMLHRISSTNHQHPDHDTDHWSPSG